ncbi:hypothetical protein GCM10020000_87700 [Streptomyces olivoverticillatus]
MPLVPVASTRRAAALWAAAWLATWAAWTAMLSAAAVLAGMRTGAEMDMVILFVGRWKGRLRHRTASSRQRREGTREVRCPRAGRLSRG